jgi:pantoate--beta-alanine ligase
MQIHHTIASIRHALKHAPGAPSQAALSPEVGLQSLVPTVGLVPTMGALHEGHLSLVRAARRDSQSVVVSIFVNPTQFAPHEDFSQYPRTFESDCALLEAERVEHVFAPSADEMYPPGNSATFIEVPGISDRLDGKSRPGHFRGVATVVAKLFNIVQPSLAYFGQKDAAQVAVLRALVRDLNLPVELRICPTVRDPDGLALSSRNRFLSSAERTSALSLSRALKHAQSLVDAGANRKIILPIMLDILKSAPGLRLDYLEIVDPDTLLPHPSARPPVLIAVSAWAGTTRLIDNIAVGVPT